MVPMTTPLHPSNYLSFYRVPLLVTAATTSLSPKFPPPPLIFQESSLPTSGASLAPAPDLFSGPHLHPHSNCGLLPTTPTASEDPLRTLSTLCILQDTSLLQKHRGLSESPSEGGTENLQDPENMQTQTRSPGHFPQSLWERERVSERKS